MKGKLPMNNSKKVEEITKVYRELFPDGVGIKTKDKHTICVYKILKILDLKDIPAETMEDIALFKKSSIVIEKNRLKMNKLNKHIRHLNQDEIVEMINDYYAGENTKRILQKYDIRTGSQMLIKYFPLYISDFKCSFCNENMLYKLKSRSVEKLDIREYEVFCNNCNKQLEG